MRTAWLILLVAVCLSEACGGGGRTSLSPEFPSITTQPASQSVRVGEAVLFTVGATGTSPLSYQWRKNGAAIGGANSATYTTPATTTSDNGAQFTVLVGNSAGTVTSDAAILTVNASSVGPSITTQPASQTVTAGQTATFSVTASGTAPLSYQWHKNGTAINGANSASYTTPATSISDNAAQFAVAVSNSAGTVTSNAAILTVNPSSSGGTWQKVNTPAAATQINYIAFNNSNHWFLADRTTGFWKSIDQGTTWTPINTAISQTAGWTIQVNPANGDLIAGTVGNTVFYRSTNEGTSWTLIPMSFSIPTGAASYSGCAFPPNGNIVCGGFWGPTPQSATWVSTDGGVTTTESTVSPTDTAATMGLAYNPVTSEIWRGTEDNGISRSVDNGFTFILASPLACFISSPPCIGGNDRSFAFDQAGNVLVADQAGLWKSLLSGGVYTWTRILQNNNTSGGMALGQDPGGNLYYSHHNDPNDLIPIFRSVDNGNTWSAFNSGVPDGLEAHEFIFNPADGDMYAVMEDGKTNAGTIYRISVP